jgi:hypothetical protein
MEDHSRYPSPLALRPGEFKLKSGINGRVTPQLFFRDRGT